MNSCPECNSNDIYQYKDLIETTTISGELLPKLGAGMFTSAEVSPVVCAQCGYLRLYVSKDATERMKTSEHWIQL